MPSSDPDIYICCMVLWAKTDTLIHSFIPISFSIVQTLLTVHVHRKWHQAIYITIAEVEACLIDLNTKPSIMLADAFIKFWLQNKIYSIFPFPSTSTSLSPHSWCSISTSSYELRSQLTIFSLCIYNNYSPFS